MLTKPFAGISWRSLTETRFMQQIFVLSGSTALAQGILIAALPVITRVYAPSEYGSYATFSALVSVLFVPAMGRLELAIPLAQTREDLVALLSICLTWAVGWLVSLWLVFSLFLDPITIWLQIEADTRVFAWVPFGTFAASLFQLMTFLAIRQERYYYVARGKLLQNIAQSAGQIGLGVTGFGLVGLVAGDIGGRSLAALSGWRLFRLPWRTVHGIRDTLRRHSRFPLYAMPAAIAQTVFSMFPLIFLAAAVGPQAAGFFGLMQRAWSVPATLVSRSVGQVFYGESARRLREAPQQTIELVRTTLIRMLLAGVVIFGLAAAVAPWLFAMVFGEAWSEAGRYLQIMTPAFIAQFAVGPVYPVLNLLGRQSIIFSIFLAGTGTLVVVLLTAGDHQAAVDILKIVSACQCATMTALGLSVWFTVRRVSLHEVNVP